MSEIGEQLDKIIRLTSKEDLLIFGPKKKKRAEFALDVEETREYYLTTSLLETVTITNALKEGLHQIEFYSIQFPKHEQPPLHVFDYTLAAFIHRRSVEQWTYEFFRKNNSCEYLNMVKLNAEYKECESILTSLINDLQTTRSFKTVNHNISLMKELDIFLENLSTETEYNIGFLRKLEKRLIRLKRVHIWPTETIAKLDYEYRKKQNEYHDERIIKARQLRYNKNLFNAQMAQITIRDNLKVRKLCDEFNELNRMSEQELRVFDESSKFNMMAIEEYKEKIQEMSIKYEDDILNLDFEILRAQSEHNYFEEEWTRKMLFLNYMKEECEKYIQSVVQRKREAIAKRFGAIWVAAARAAIYQRKRKQKRLAKKNKKREENKRG